VKKKITLLAFFICLLSINSWGQGAPACPAVTCGPGATTCSGQCSNLTAALVTNNQTNSYSVSAIPYVPYSYTTGTPILIATDDIWTPVENIGFNFCYFGNTYNQFVIGANGHVCFNLANASAFDNYTVTTPLPSTADMPANCINAVFRDIDPALGGQCYYKMYGAAPCRTMVVSWNNIPLYDNNGFGVCNGTPNSTFQLVFYENTNYIDVYIEATFSCPGWQTGYGIVGLLDPTGTIAVCPPGRNCAAFTTGSEAWRFTPTGAPSYTFNWTAGGPSLGTTTTLNVCPATTTTYTATMVLTNCDGSHITVSDQETITIAGTLAAPASSTNPSCNGVSDGTASVIASGGTGPYTYSWAPAGSVGAGQATANASGLGAGSYVCTITDHGGCSVTSGVTLTAPSAITIGTSTIPAGCGNPTGTANVTSTTGGTGAYTYSWTPAGSIGGGQGTTTATGLVAGNYTITITDHSGCTQASTLTIINTGSPTAVISSSTNELCAGASSGSATVTAAGGSGALTYSWDSAPSQATATATLLPAGVYTVTVTDHTGCQITASVTITQPTAPTATSSHVDPLCNGANTGSATVNPSGGTGAYTYSWTPAGSIGGGQGSATATGLVAGTYTGTVTDNNGCAISSVLTLAQPPAITGTFTQTTVSCHGGTDGTASITPGGGTGAYTYSWTPAGLIGGGQSTAGVNGLAAGVYTCTITDHNLCSNSFLVTITQPAQLTATTSVVTSTCGNANGSASVTASNGTGLYTYSWSPSGGTGTTEAGLLAGTYTVTVTDANNCVQTATAIVPNAGGPTASIATETDPLCAGASTGSITVTAVGGFGALTYSWSPFGGAGATGINLSAGTFTCTVNDANGCANSITTLLKDPPALSATTTQINEDCNGGLSGSGTINASGGTPGYTYLWSPTGGNSATSIASPAGTYTCATSDAHGCKINSIITITEPPAIIGTIAQVNVLCNGSNTGSATITASGGTGALSYSWSPFGGAATTATSLTAGLYTCVVNDAVGCNSGFSVTITEPTTLTATSSSNVSTCGNPNGSVTATGNGGNGPYAYSWTPGGASTATATGLAAGTYTCVVTDANGCTASVNATIVNQGGPTVALGVVTNVTCFGICNGTAAVTVTGGTGVITYSWTPSGGTIANATGLCPGIYTCTVTDANGCSTSTTTPITQPTAITLSIPASTNVACNGGITGSATAVASGGTGALGFSWNPSGIITASANGLTAGEYTVTATDANGCIQVDSVKITQPVLLSVSVAGVATKCLGSCDGVLICIPAGGVSPYTYSWNTGCTTPSCNNNCAGTYSVTVTDANGCTVNGTTIITQPTAIILSMFAVPAHCMHADGTDSVFAMGGSPAALGYSYSWTPGVGSALSGYDNVSPGVYVVTVQDANGCIAKDSLSVGNTPGVRALVVSDASPSCFGGSNGSAVAGGAGGTLPYAYLWTAPVVSAIDTGKNLSAGTYYFTVTDARGCFSKDSVLILQPTPVVASPMAPLTLCIGQCIPLTSTATGGTPGYTYAWTTGGVVAPSPACPVVTTTYTVIASDNNNCASVPVPVLVTVRPPLLVVATGDSSVCPGGTVQLHATASGGDGNFSYSWSTALGLNNTTISNPASNPVTTTIYTVVVKDGCGTPLAQATDTVTVFPTPTVLFTANDTSGCVQLCVNFNGLSNPACANATWVFGDGSSGTGCNSVLHCYTQPGTYSVTQNVTDIHGCKNSLTRSNYIDAWPTPEAAFTLGPQPATIVLSEITFTDHSIGAISWNWNFGDFSGASSTIQNPQYTYPDTGCFTSLLIVTNTFGCTDTASGPLCIHPDFSFYAPNAFTPNGDNKNDIWKPSGLGIDPSSYHMMMFDRWGNLMWETKIWDQGWDGKANNGDLTAQIDTYVWKCTVNDFLGGSHAFTGVCNLLH